MSGPRDNVVLTAREAWKSTADGCIVEIAMLCMTVASRAWFGSDV